MPSDGIPACCFTSTFLNALPLSCKFRNEQGHRLRELKSLETGKLIWRLTIIPIIPRFILVLIPILVLFPEVFGIVVVIPEASGVVASVTVIEGLFLIAA